LGGADGVYGTGGGDFPSLAGGAELGLNPGVPGSAGILNPGNPGFDEVDADTSVSNSIK
jgi:hypothetical protein